MSDFILIIDDELLVRKALARLFSNQGYSVLEAENGAAGLELFLAHDPKVVFLDIMMPVMTGPEFIQEIKSRGFLPSRIVLMSAVQDTSHIPFIKEVKAFIPKPFENLFGLKDLANESH